MERILTDEYLRFYTTTKEGARILLLNLKLDANNKLKTDSVGSLKLDTYHNLAKNEKALILSEEDYFLVHEPAPKNHFISLPAVFFSEKAKSMYLQHGHLNISTQLNDMIENHEVISDMFNLSQIPIVSQITVDNQKAATYTRYEELGLADLVNKNVTTYNSDLDDKQCFFEGSKGRVNLKRCNEGKWDSYNLYRFLDKDIQIKIYKNPIVNYLYKNRKMGRIAGLAALSAACFIGIKGCQTSEREPAKPQTVSMHQPNLAMIQKVHTKE